MDKKTSRSKFYLVRCECGAETFIFSSVSTEVKCDKCKRTLAIPTGGASKIIGEVKRVI
ncbi:MAG: 30S ribosomal protein S27e [Candidatus Micrarchaeia archaeon]